MYYPIKILVADDHKIFREGLKLMFRKSQKIRLVGEAADGKEAIDIAEQLNPDVILMDIEMPVMNGVEATRELNKNHPGIGIIALSSYNEPIRIKTMLESGARGYLLKDADEREVQSAVEEIHNGGSYYSAGINERLDDMAASDASDAITFGGIRFRTKEVQIMQLICEEYSSKQIGAEMKLKPRTIEWYRDGLITKTGSKTIAGVICFALRHKIDEFRLNI